MANFCSIDGTLEQKRVVLEDGYKPTVEYANSKADLRDGFITNTNEILRDNNIDTGYRAMYCNYLQKKGINAVGVEPSDITLDVSSGVRKAILSRYGSYHIVDITNQTDGTKRGVTNTNPLMCKCKDLYGEIDVRVMQALRGGNDSVILDTENKLYLVSFGTDLVELGTEQDMKEFDEYRQSLKNSDNEYQSMINEVSPENSETKRDITNEQRIGLDLAEKMSKRIGVSYQIVTPEQAMEITKTATKAYTEDTNEPAFFYNGVVYFVKGKINSKSVFHEFAHPVIRGIRNENPALFESLYEQVKNTSEGAAIISELMLDKDLTQPENEQYFKEEAIAKALSALNESTLENSDSVLSKIMYIIRQALRRWFGKDIKVHQLKPSTTLEDLVTILNDGGQIYVDTSKFKDDTIVVYDMINLKDGAETSAHEYVRENGGEKVLNHINNVHEGMKTLLSNMLKNDDFQSMSEILGEQKARKLFEETQNYTPENFTKRVEQMKNNIQKFKDSYEENKDLAVGFVATITALNDIAKDMLTALDNLNITDYRRAVNQVYYADKIVKSWKNFIEQVDDQCSEDDFGNLVHTLRRRLEKCEKICFEYKKDNVKEFVAKQLWQMKDFADNRYKSRIERSMSSSTPNAVRYREDEHIKYRGMTPAEYADFCELYAKYKDGRDKSKGKLTAKEILTPEEYLEFGKYCAMYEHGYEITDMRIDLTVNKLMGDAGWFNCMVESFTSNQNLVGMSLATYITQEYGNALNTSLENLRNDYNAVDQILKDAGLGNRDSKLRDTLCFLDDVFVFDADAFAQAREEYAKSLTGTEEENRAALREWERNQKRNFVPKQVWTYLNEFKGYRRDFDMLMNNLISTRSKWKSTLNKDDYQAYLEAKKNMDRLLSVYFHRKYKPEFYVPDLELQEATYNGENIGMEILEERDAIIEQINALNGIIVDDKESVNKEIELLFKQLRQMSLDYNFDGSKKTGRDLAKARALRNYNQQKAQFNEYTFNVERFKESYDEFVNTHQGDQDAIDNWVNQNTRTQPTEEYFIRRSELMARKQAIYDAHKNQSPEDVADYAEMNTLWGEIMELTKTMRNNEGYIDGYSAEQLQRLNELEDKIDDIRKRIYERHTISREDYRFYETWKPRINIVLNEDTKKRFYEIQERINSKILFTPEETQVLDDIEEQLDELQTRGVTQEYIDDFRSVFNSLKPTEQNALLDGIGNEINEENVELILENKTNTIEDLRKNHKSFDEWFTRAHKTFNGKYYIRYAFKRSYINEAFLMNDENLSGIIGAQYGSRVPIMKYMDKGVKQEYETEKVVGKTIDVNGEYLPLGQDDMQTFKANYEKATGKKFESLKVPTVVTNGNNYNVSEENARIDKYHNQKYFDLQRTNPKAFEALEKLKKIHLDRQQDTDAGTRLYYDIARFRMSNAQGVREGKPLKTAMMRLRQMFVIDEEDVYDGSVSYNRAANSIRADWLEGGEPNEPIIGLFNIDADLCEDNIFMANERYYRDIDRHRALVAMNPIVRTVQDVVNGIPVKDTKKVTTQGTEVDFANEKTRGKTNNLIDFVNALIGREFDGKFRLDEWNGRLEKYYIASYKWLAGRASTAYFAVDIQSALKNFLGQKIQSIIEASGGTGFNLQEFMEADKPAYEVINEMVTKGYVTPVHSLLYQLVQHFDMIPGETRNKFSQEFANTLGRELLDGNNGTRLRKLSEMQATIQIGFAVLMNKKIQIKQNGEVKTIRYMDAFELKDDNLTLKDGIDARYGLQDVVHIVEPSDTKESICEQYNIPVEDVDKVFRNLNLDEIKERKRDYIERRDTEITSINNSSMSEDKKRAEIERVNAMYDKLISTDCIVKIQNDFFRTTRLTITDTFEQLNGAYQEYSQPMMNQYLLMKPFLFLRKYYVSMLMHKYGTRGMFKHNGRMFFSSRFNASKQIIEDGVYVDTLNTLYECMLYGMENIAWMDDAQKANMVRFFTEIIFVGAILPIMSSLVMFGFGGDDKDKYKSQKDKNALVKSWSGTIFDDNFNFGGYTRQAALLQLLKLQDEQAQFNPFLKGITGAYNIGFKSSIVFATVTVDNWFSALSNLMGLLSDQINGVPKDDSDNYYTRDQGPYWWQKKGAPKFINYYMKSWGLNGSNIDPATSYKNFISYMNNMKR